MRIENRSFTLTEVKLADDGAAIGTFEGYGAVFGNVDAYGDVIAKGAFAGSLREAKARGKFAPMLLQHGGSIFGGAANDMLPVGKWEHMEERPKGLWVEGKLFALKTERGQYILEGLKSGALDGLSIGYRVRKSTNGTKPGEPRRTLTEIDLVEVSIVTFPANPKARVTSAKHALAASELRELEAALGDRGLSRSDRLTAVTCFKNWLQREAAELVDDDQREAESGDSEPDDAVKAAETLLARIVNSDAQRAADDLLARILG